MARYAYYCGNVNYNTMDKLYEMYAEIKSFLRTDGKAWRAPISDFSKYAIEIKPIIRVELQKPCDQLIYYENELTDRNYEKLYFPLPYMDTDKSPHAIAVPFKNYILRNIQGKNAAFILVKYFITVSKCLEEKRASYDVTLRFYTDFEMFLDDKVRFFINYLFPLYFYSRGGHLFLWIFFAVWVLAIHISKYLFLA